MFKLTSLKRMYRTFPKTTRDPHERAWRRQHFREMWVHEWKLFKLNRLFTRLFFFSEEKRKRRSFERDFYLLNHPLHPARQAADWYKLGPSDPPPAVRRSVENLVDTFKVKLTQLSHVPW